MPVSLLTAAEANCARRVRIKRALVKPLYFCGSPGRCECCGEDLSGQRYFGDCKVPPGSAWGMLCPECIHTLGVAFGWGRAQLYRRVDHPDGQWLLVAGFPPADPL